VSIPDFAEVNRRENRLALWVGILAVAVVLLAGTVGVLVVQVQDTAEDTNDLVTLLENRTPLFAELQASEDRTECIVETLARGLAAYAAGDHQTLTDYAASLLALGTPNDPCPPGLEEP